MTTLSARLRSWGALHRLELTIAATVLFSCAYFFQGGGWNQNAHVATTVALVEDGTLFLDDYRRSTGDLSHAGDRVVSAKPLATALLAIPGYVVSRTLALAADNPGDRVILAAYGATVLTAGAALAGLAVVLFVLLRRRLSVRDATFLALALTLATPLFPNSTMMTSHPVALLAAAAAFALLDGAQLARHPPSPRVLLGAGLCAGASAASEYTQGIVCIVLGAYALWLARPWNRAAWFVLGVGVMALVPLIHHTIAFGHPLHVGYASLTDKRMAADAARGVMGFGAFRLDVLYELTFGNIRGFFTLSPLLVGCIPGVLRLLREPRERPQGMVCATLSWGILLLISCLAYWHSGSSVGSRYALVFVVFSALPLATLMRPYRRWLALGAAMGFAFMVMATSVTAIPPTPGRHPYTNVLRWLWARFSEGRLASWQQPIIIHRGAGTSDPTLPYAFNLGQLMGLPGLWSLVPYGAGMALLGWALYRAERSHRRAGAQ